MVNAAEAYKRQQILTATPEQLTLMLYNGCLKFIGEGIDAVSAKKYEAGNTALQKAQRIISEFRLTLNMDTKFRISCFRSTITFTIGLSRAISKAISRNWKKLAT